MLLGVVDTDALTIHVCVACPAPEDSVASPTGFECRIVGLQEQVAKASALTGGQLVYVREWHSHPRLHSTQPSLTDLTQLSEFAQIQGMSEIPD